MEILGHRGARGEAPENTLSGFRHLRALGLRSAEFDIQVSADGQLVVIHDSTVDRTTSSTGPVASFTALQLGEMDACHHRLYRDAFEHEFSWSESDGIPLLEDVLALFPDSPQLQLEVKASSKRDIQTVVNKLPPICRRFGPRAVTTSFSVDYLSRMQKAAPDIPRGLLVEKDFAGDVVGLAVSLQCVSIGPHYTLCTPELVSRAHAAGLQVSTWTVNESSDMLALREMGVDSIITDFPQKAIRLLR
ncbi:MAG TPA: glycerophosphodiester phosphodiesterase [Fluviicoccus sp.]|nr:glycerophosphodiester phosphodiesterase [Fluviicoccus sp.]